MNIRQYTALAIIATATIVAIIDPFNNPAKSSICIHNSDKGFFYTWFFDGGEKLILISDVPMDKVLLTEVSGKSLQISSHGKSYSIDLTDTERLVILTEKNEIISMKFNGDAEVNKLCLEIKFGDDPKHLLEVFRNLSISLNRFR